MDIGGDDLTLHAPRQTYQPRRILEIVRVFWPKCVYEDANGPDESAATSVRHLLKKRDWLPAEEFFLYRDPSSARDWDDNGESEDNKNDMLHVLKDRRATTDSTLALTLVIGEMTAEMARIYAALDDALAHSNATSTERAPAAGKIEPQLRAAGSALNARAFKALVADLKRALYPDWTPEELACNPHDALHFCSALRTRINARVPDRLIMRTVLDRAKRSRKNGS